jgi:hypothetical protein
MVLLLLVLINARDTQAIRLYENGRWAGTVAEDVISNELNQMPSVLIFWVQDTQLNILKLVAMNRCTERLTDRDSQYWVNLGKDATQVTPFYIDATGNINGGYMVPDGVYKGLTIQLRGNIRGRTGRVILTLSSTNDLENCAQTTIFNMKKISSELER